MKVGTPIAMVSILATAFLAATCSVKNNGSSIDGGLGAGVNMSCESTPCRARLTCDSASKTCKANPTVLQGGTCILSAECVAGNYCTQEGKCAPAGQGPVGSECSSDGDCAVGLACILAGLTGTCQQPAPAAADYGQGCTQPADCLPGLLCVSGVCGKAADIHFAAPPSCPAEDSVARVDFRVPRSTDSLSGRDFYRLPFPNDIRMKNGTLSLAGHPTPGPTILPFDMVARYISAIEAESTGFGANQAIYFRLSKSFRAEDFPQDCGAELVDITPSSPTYGRPNAFQCGAQTGSATYICGPYLWLRPQDGHPLRPGTTYAVLLHKTITDLVGATFDQDDDFTAMLAPTAPTNADLAAAYAAYQPLRDYLATHPATPATDLASAAVFTVAKYEDALAAIDNTVASLPVPTIGGWVHCGDPGVVSPCDDHLTGDAHVRGCLPEDSADPSFDTYQGTLGLPVFQKGTPPYLTEGGDIDYQSTGGAVNSAPDGSAVVASDPDGGGPNPDGGGAIDSGGIPAGPALAAVVQRTEKVCFSLTVPKGVAPVSGWPLVVYGHGTGGSYRSIVQLDLAHDYATGIAPPGAAPGALATPVPMAVLGYEGIMHGTRAGGSTTPVGELVYNFLNPHAARDNALQAAADLLAIPHAVSGLAGLGVPVDGARMALYGHSQGGNAASLVAARESPYRTIVMSGTGGLLIHTLLGKTQPVNVPAVLPFLLGEIGPVDASHPVLNLMQMYFERSDTVNFGRRLFRDTLPSMTPHNVLHVYGTGDSFSVVPTERAFALSASLWVAAPPIDEFGLPHVAPPVFDNDGVGPYYNLTAVEIQYQPAAGVDGHFVSTQNLSARAAIQQMLVTTFRDGIATVSP